ncbi:MAG TPA: hypothetical protein VIP77_16090 [Jiangellaceae bacterium]
MLWQQTVTAFVWVLALNRWLAETQPALEPELEWTPVVNQDGEVVQ